MKSRWSATLIMLVLSVALTLAAAAKERVKTDGKNKNSPIKVVSLDFSDGGGSSVVNPDLYPIRTSVEIKNTGKDDLKGVDIKLQLKNGAEETVNEYTQKVGILKAGATYKFEPGQYYNYNRIPLHAAVEIEHDPIEEEKKDDKKP